MLQMSPGIATKAAVLLSTLLVVSSWTPALHSSQVFHSLRPGNFDSHHLRTTAIVQEDAWRREPVEEADYVICGGGPAGLLSAIMLAKKFPSVSRQFFH